MSSVTSVRGEDQVAALGLSGIGISGAVLRVLCRVRHRMRVGMRVRMSRMRVRMRVRRSRMRVRMSRRRVRMRAEDEGRDEGQEEQDEGQELKTEPLTIRRASGR